MVEILTDSVNPRDYWFKMKSLDGKMRLTDCADVESLLRIIQSVPSLKAEALKQWLAKVGYQRMSEIVDPAKGLDRAKSNN